MKHLFLSLLLLATGGVASLAQAEAPLAHPAAGFVSLKGGYASPTNFNSRLGIGLDAGMVLSNGLTGLVYYLTSDGSQAGSDTRVNHYGLGVDYSLAAYLPSALNAVHGGVRLGLGDIHSSGTMVSGPSHTDLAAGLDLGWDYFLLSNVSLGLEADWFVTFSGRSVSTFYGLANLRYSF